MRVVSLKMNSNVYPLKNTNSHYLLLNTTIVPLCNGKISLNFLRGSEAFMKVFKAFIEPFEAPQRSVTIKI